MPRFRNCSVIAALLALAVTTPAYAQVVLHRYTFNTDASDSVGSANGTLTGGASVSGGVLNLNGTDGYVQFATKIVPTSGSYSVAISARQSTAQGNFIELISQGFSGGPGFYIGYDPNSVIRASDSWGNTGVPFQIDGQFHDYLLTVDATNSLSSLYIDNTLRATLATAITTTTGGTATRFGRQFDPFNEFFNGSIDNVSIYSGVVNPQATATPEPGVGLMIVSGLLPIAGAILKRRRK